MRFASILLSATVLAGCAAGTLATTPPQPVTGAPAQSKHAKVTFRILVPRPQHHRSRFVSPATRSITITVEPGTAGQQVFNQNVSTGTNTFYVDTYPGAQTINVQTHDGSLDPSGNPTGHLLSANLFFPITVQAGKANVISITLQGIPTGIAVVPNVDQDITGNVASGFNLVGAYQANGVTLFARRFTAIATDADGNYILGAGAPVVTAVSSNTGVVSNGTASSHNPNLFTVVPAGGSTFPQNASMTFTATPSSSSGASPISVSIGMRVPNANAPRIYAENSNGSVLVYDESGNSISLGNSPFSTMTSSIGGPIVYDAHNNTLYAVGGGSLRAFNLAGQQLASTAVGNIFSMAFDPGTAHLYLATQSAPLAVYDEALNAVATGSWNEQSSGSPPGYPSSIVADSSNGTIYVMDAGGAARLVQPYTTAGTAIAGGHFFPNVPSGGFLTGLTQDPATGDLFVTNGTPSSTAVQVFDESGAAVALAAGAFSGLTESSFAEWDATSGRVYIEDASSVTRLAAFDSRGNAIATSGGFPGMTSGVVGFTIVP